MNWNWSRFFFRLTVIISIIGFLIGGFLIGWGHDFSLIVGILLGGLVWVIYFVVRWLIRGLRS